MRSAFRYAATMGAMAVSALALIPNAAYAGCGIEGGGSVRILANDFPALRAVVTTAEECAGDGVTVSKNMTSAHQQLMVPALSANPAEYTSAFVATSSIQPLIANGLVQPLDGFIAEYGDTILDKQKISIGGKVMAIAFDANAQHLFYRADILKEAGVEPPKTYEEVLEAAEAIRAKGLMQYPITGTYKAGWNLAEEFVNMYIGYGGEFFEPGSAKAAIDNDKGVEALEMMKKLSAYMNPDFLTFDSNSVQAEFEAGNAALSNFWGSRYGAVVDEEGARPEIAGAIAIGPAPTVGGGSIPATTLWWDGFTIAKNISEKDAAATFQALAHGASAKMANANTDAAVWLIDGYEPGKEAEVVLKTMSMGGKTYPSNPSMGLLHTALGNEIVDFMQGKEDAAKALADTEAAYTAAAKEQGFL